MPDDIVIIGVPGPGDPNVVEIIGELDGTITIPVPDAIVIIGVPGPGDPNVIEIIGELDGTITIPGEPGPELVERVVALEENDAEQDTRLGVLEALSGGGLDVVQELIDTTVATHVQAAEPHPIYDDLPSLTLLFENGLI